AGNNAPSCDFDGGDCCQSSCIDGSEFACGIVGYDCLT
ncbi:unnamed protein product, partial [Hapterophycus canaliculatus]